ncbi:MAG: hypothetical protein V3U02_00360 [Calditrichia bacterium]
MDKFCYEDTALGCFSRKYYCLKRLARSGCCYQHTNPPKTWKNCPFGKLHKHYTVDVEAEKAKLAKAKSIKTAILNEICEAFDHDPDIMNKIEALDLEGVILKLL